MAKNESQLAGVPPDSLTDSVRFLQVRSIADLVFESVTKREGDSGPGVWMEDWRYEKPSPSRGQTHRGFYLRGEYAALSSLFTPWGLFTFGGRSGGWTPEIRQQILDRLEVRTLPDSSSLRSTHEVHKIDDLILPDPIFRPENQYIPDDKALLAWIKLARQFPRSAQPATGPLHRLAAMLRRRT